ncbi:MAG: response regulator [Pirellulaceae bacterium]|nr:response regulator [Pirellulaceae bacterium]
MSEREKTVLHVDDDPALLRIVSARLSAHGYRVISETSVERCMVRLLEEDCRVAILDIDMPGKDGLELLTDIKRLDGGIQVIMLTGLVSINTILESMRRGAEACIFKPVTDYDQLLETLEGTFKKVDRWWGTLDELNTRKTRQTTSK